LAAAVKWWIGVHALTRAATGQRNDSNGALKKDKGPLAEIAWGGFTGGMKFMPICRGLALTVLFVAASPLCRADQAASVAAIKGYLLQQVNKMDAAAHSYVDHATAYQKLVDANGGDYSRMAINDGPAVLDLIAKMQADYKNLHMNGYETVEGIAAGVKELVQYDIYFDSGLPSDQASTDSPAAPIDLKTASGETIDNREGNLFHYVIEPALWGAKADFVKRLSPEASAKIHGIAVLPRADVCLASAKDSAVHADQFLAASQSWQPTMDECVGALVWMTPTFNTYFDDLRDSLYNPSGKYISESRVLDMRGIMGSLQLVYNAIRPQLEAKDPALAAQLASEYQGIMHHIDETDRRDKAMRAQHQKLSQVEIEEMAEQAKRMSDQLAPQLEQVAVILGLKLPPKPFLG
jgi:hypothetical protein